MFGSVTPTRSPAHVVVLVLLAFTVLALAAPLAGAQDENQPPRVLAWNDLGMHCMDPDFSVFTILPPFNTINAQAIRQGQVVTSQQVLALTYEASADATGSINRTSIGKTNFWDFDALIFGVDLPLDVGLSGFGMPGPANIPQGMHADAAADWYQAEGIPITPFDDAFEENTYPLMKVRARTPGGVEVASTRTAAPVSFELECSLCHASNASPFAKPDAGWAFDPDPLKDDRYNILRLHDDRHVGQPLHAAAITAVGFDPAGLEATARGGQPILCAACHGTNALGAPGQPGISALTAALHGRHSTSLTPNGLALDEDPSRNSCFSCHPGRVTQCLRGAMGKAIDADGGHAMQCQSCHGGMATVGDPLRVGWLEQPSCQQCHTGTATNNAGAIRFASVFDAQGNPHVPADPIFATNADVPAAGFDLYRFSTGHGGLQCSACHGSTHAIYPTSFANDNVQSIEFQGHEGTISECSECHSKDTLETFLTGPHDMHPVGLKWAKSDHGDAAEQLGLGSCRACHGADLRSTELSRSHADRNFALGSGFGARTFFRGENVSCWACHDGPNDEDPTNNGAPVASNKQFATPNDTPLPIDLTVSDPQGNPLTYRIVKQPLHGSVALSGAAATYLPSGDYIGADSFTYAAYDGKLDSNLATVRLDVQAPACAGTIRAYGFGCPGGDGDLPVLSAAGCPSEGETLTISVRNGVGGGRAVALLGGGTGELGLKNGCVLRIAPLLPGMINFLLDGSGSGQGSADFDALIPVGVTGVTLTLQVFVIDDSVSNGYTSTNALEFVFP